MRWLVLLLLIATAGCGRSAMDAGPDTEIGKKLISELQRHDFDSLLKQFSPEALAVTDRSKLSQVANAFPAEKPRSIKLASWRWLTIRSSAQGTTTAIFLELEYEFDTKWFLVQMKWRKPTTDTILLDVLHIEPLPASLESINRFNFQGKGVTNYVMIVATSLAALFSVAVLVLCLIDRMRWISKALWTIAIIFGIGQVGLNWTTGTISTAVLHLQLLSAGYSRPGLLGPWYLTVSLPLGAILFLYLRWKRRSAAPASEKAVA